MLEGKIGGGGFAIKQRRCLSCIHVLRSEDLRAFKGGIELYKLAAPRKAFFLDTICRAKNDLPVTKIRL